MPPCRIYAFRVSVLGSGFLRCCVHCILDLLGWSSLQWCVLPLLWFFTILFRLIFLRWYHRQLPVKKISSLAFRPHRNLSFLCCFPCCFWQVHGRLLVCHHLLSPQPLLHVVPLLFQLASPSPFLETCLSLCLCPSPAHGPFCCPWACHHRMPPLCILHQNHHPVHPWDLLSLLRPFSVASEPDSKSKTSLGELFLFQWCKLHREIETNEIVGLHVRIHHEWTTT